MATRTVHVIPAKAKGRWMVTKSGRTTPATFATRKEATDEAKRLLRGKPGQVVVLTESGRIVPISSHGLPKLQPVGGRSRIGTKAIEKAVSSVVRERLTSA